MPELSAAEFSGAAYGSIRGFHQPVSFAVSLSGSTHFTVTTNTALMDADVSGTSSLTINGNAASVIANISGQAKYNGYGIMATDNAVVKASGQASVYVNVGKVFTTDASGQSKIYYRGNPATKNIIQTGMGRVVIE